MRLTLRTLLAYLNDTLDSSQAREIGRKIDESDYAKTLTNRIREVVRKRRLLAPDMQGAPAGIDPNLISEYLDNALAPDRVAALEKQCLENDSYLAEVAAADQIRTLAVCEPVDVSEELASRMYRLNPTYNESAAFAETAPVAAGNGADSAGRTEMPVIGSNRQRRQPIDRYELPAAPMWQRLLPLGIIVALTTAWLWIMVGDPTLFLTPGDETTAATEPVVPENDAVDPAESEAAGSAVAAADQVPDDLVEMNLQQEPAAGGSGPLNAGRNPMNIDAPPPADAGDVVQNPPDAVANNNNVAAVANADKAAAQPAGVLEKAHPFLSTRNCFARHCYSSNADSYLLPVNNTHLHIRVCYMFYYETAIPNMFRRNML